MLQKNGEVEKHCDFKMKSIFFLLIITSYNTENFINRKYILYIPLKVVTSLVDKEEKQEQGEKEIICMKCPIPFKLHVLRPDEKVEGSIQLRNELGNGKVK